jgi:DNA recombination protein RmuC
VAVLWSHLEHLRDSLVSAVDSFDAAVGSLESRVLPSVRKFKQMGALTEDDIEALEKIGREPRTLRLNAIEIKTSSGQ